MIRRQYLRFWPQNWVSISQQLYILTRLDLYRIDYHLAKCDPLFQLLFEIALEPLAMGIRGHSGIHGIKFGKVESLVNLYADDLLLCFSDQVVSVPNLWNNIKSFNKLSGYTTNWDESEFKSLRNNLSLSFI